MERLFNLKCSKFIHSFGHFYSAPSSPLLLRGAPDHSTDTISEFHAEAPQATVSKGLAQGPHVAARAGVEPTTLRLNQCAATSHKYETPHIWRHAVVYAV